MKYFLFLLIVFGANNVVAQKVRKADLLGTWHLSQIIIQGHLFFDAADPKVGRAAMLDGVRKGKPRAAKSQEDAALAEMKKIQESYPKIYTIYKADGSFEAVDINTVSEPGRGHSTGTFELDEQSGTLTTTYNNDGKVNVDKAKIEKGLLTIDVRQSGMQMIFKR